MIQIVLIITLLLLFYQWRCIQQLRNDVRTTARILKKLGENHACVAKALEGLVQVMQLSEDKNILNEHI